MGRTRWWWAAVGLAAACTAGGASGSCRAAVSVGTDSPAAVSVGTGSFEEAAMIALGELFRVYGADAEPLPAAVRGEPTRIGTAPAWYVDGRYEVTVDGRREVHRWRLWVGNSGDGLAVLCADPPPGVSWP